MVRRCVGGVCAVVLASGVGPIEAQQITEGETGQSQVIELTLERMVDLALNNSFEIRQVNFSIERTQLRLKAERARLRSRVDLDLQAPTLRAQSEPRFDPTIERTRTFRENSQRYQYELSVRQPVVLFGYHTNGFISLNNRMHRFDEEDADGDVRVEYFNEYFIRYTQPLFQPNDLKNDIEEAELDLEDAELNFYDDVVDLIDETSDDYFDLFRNAYQQGIRAGYVADLEAALDLATQIAEDDPARAIEIDQVNVELANAREQLQQSQSQYRLETAGLKTDFNLPPDADLRIDPVVDLEPVPIDVEDATRYALDLTPRLRQLDINLRENEISVENVKGRGGVQVDLAVSFGTEKRDELFGELWAEPDNSFSFDLEADIPIWDWGERKARIQESEIRLRQTRLRIEQATADIRSDVENEVRNVEEFQSRALAMQETLALAEGITENSLVQYRGGTISVLDLLQNLRREFDTAGTFLDTYLGWRRALLRLQQMTYFDFERGAPLLERYGIDFNGESSF